MDIVNNEYMATVTFESQSGKTVHQSVCQKVKIFGIMQMVKRRESVKTVKSSENKLISMISGVIRYI